MKLEYLLRLDNFKTTIKEGNTELKKGDSIAAFEEAEKYYGHDAITLTENDIQQLRSGMIIFGNNGEYSFSISYKEDEQ